MLALERPELRPIDLNRVDGVRGGDRDHQERQAARNDLNGQAGKHRARIEAERSCHAIDVEVEVAHRPHRTKRPLTAGRSNDRRRRSTSTPAAHPRRWSLTSPIAWMNE